MRDWRVELVDANPDHPEPYAGTVVEATSEAGAEAEGIRVLRRFVPEGFRMRAHVKRGQSVWVPAPGYVVFVRRWEERR